MTQVVTGDCPHGKPYTELHVCAQNCKGKTKGSPYVNLKTLELHAKFCGGVKSKNGRKSDDIIHI